MDITNRNDLMGEITACKSLLNESDYQLMKMLESLTDCTTATGLVKVLVSFREEFKELVASRVKWRATINECEKALDELGTETTDGIPNESAQEIPEVVTTTTPETEADDVEGEATQDEPVAEETAEKALETE